MYQLQNGIFHINYHQLIIQYTSTEIKRVSCYLYKMTFKVVYRCIESDPHFITTLTSSLEVGLVGGNVGAQVRDSVGGAEVACLA